MVDPKPNRIRVVDQQARAADCRLLEEARQHLAGKWITCMREHETLDFHFNRQPLMDCLLRLGAA
jgi:hypothetical protein